MMGADGKSSPQISYKAAGETAIGMFTQALTSQAFAGVQRFPGKHQKK